jgi:hypothetical protein
MTLPTSVADESGAPARPEPDDVIDDARSSMSKSSSVNRWLATAPMPLTRYNSSAKKLILFSKPQNMYVSKYIAQNASEYDLFTKYMFVLNV